jgi:hypothetical protein
MLSRCQLPPLMVRRACYALAKATPYPTGVVGLHYTRAA